MKIGKAPELVKKAAAMCKSKTGMLATRLLILASLQRRGMATAAVVSHKIDALIMADWERVDRRKALAMCTVEKGPVVVHEDDLAAANFPRHLVMIDQDNGNGGCHADRTLHPLSNYDHKNCRYTYDGDVLHDSCEDNNDEPSVMDVIGSNREVEGLEFNMEEEIDQAADMFIRRFRQRLNDGF